MSPVTYNKHATEHDNKYPLLVLPNKNTPYKHLTNNNNNNIQEESEKLQP